MSYCRWSSDNWRSDVYTYAHCDGSWTTHVAGRRKVGLERLSSEGKIMSAKYTLTGAYSKDIERKMMEVVDMMAATLDQPSDPRAWEHLLIYCPRDILEQRLQTLNPGA